MPESDGEFLQRAVEGDTGALKELLKRCGPQARGAIHGKIDPCWRSVLDEDDVMQVAYMEAFLHIDQLTSRDLNGFTAWLARIAQNALRDALRGLQREKRPNPAHRVRRVRSEGPAPGDASATLLEVLGVTTTTPSRQAAAAEVIKSLDAALERLPPDYRTVVELCDLKGLSVGEVAPRMGRSTGAVHMLRARAHDRLREILGGIPHSFGETA